MINRLILWLSLLGMVLTLHLWIQKARGFDQGCLGLDTHVAAIVDGGCTEVSKLSGSHLLGVSNAAWGYAFYFGLALLSFAKIVASPDWSLRLHRLGEFGVALAFLYSAYLVYQMGFVAEAWCVLCTCSAALVTLLLALHLQLRRRGGFQPLSPTERSHELGLSVAGMFAMSGVLVGVVLFVNRIGTRPLDQGSTGQELHRLVGRSLPKFIDGKHLNEIRACRFDDTSAPLDLTPFITPDTPFLGAADGVTVVSFYDPNCGHCRRHFSALLKLVESHGDRAKFYIIPRPLWPRSELQIAAVHVAALEGRSFDLWAEYFDPTNASATGLDLAQIETLFTKLELSTDNLAERLEAMKPVVQAAAAAAKAAGITATPAAFIDGLKVANYNQSPACIGNLIEHRITVARNLAAQHEASP